MTRPRAHGQRGQAFTEFLALCLALVPLLLLAPMIAKYQDMAHAVQMASRYVAFDAMNRNSEQGGWKGEAELKQEASRRFLANSDAPIKTNDSARDFDGHRNLFWRDTAGNALISDFEKDIGLGFGERLLRQRDGNAFSAGSDGKPFNHTPLHVGEAMGLPAHGVYTAGLQLKVANLPKGLMLIRPFDALDLTIRRHTSLVVNGWPAKGAASVNARIDHVKIFPGRSIAQVNAMIGGAIEFIELGNVPRPSLAKLALWEDVVPEDRLRAHSP